MILYCLAVYLCEICIKRYLIEAWEISISYFEIIQSNKVLLFYKYTIYTDIFVVMCAKLTVIN